MNASLATAEPRGRVVVLRLAAAVLAVGVSVTMTALTVALVVHLGRVPPDEASRERPAVAPIEFIPPPPQPESVVPDPEPLPTPTLPRPAAQPPAPMAPPQLSTALEPQALAPPVAGAGFDMLPPLGMGGLPALGATPDVPSRRSEAAAPTPAAILHRPAPTYPLVAQRQGIEGHVVVRLRVEPTGAVSEVVVVEAEPPGVFDAVAVDTARRYRFRPARRGAEAVRTTVEQRIVFRLKR